MTYEETAKEIIDRLFCEGCELDCYEGDKCCWATIKEALAKQVPATPDWHPDGLSEYDYNEVWYSCPFCGNEIKEGAHHCKCGQRIDWGWRK